VNKQTKKQRAILYCKHSPRCECCILSFGWSPGFWILCFNVSEHSVPSSYEQSVPKRRNIKFRRRGINQKKE